MVRPSALTLRGLAYLAGRADRRLCLIFSASTALLQVRSCTLDTWLPAQVSFMAATGNAAANSYWEAKLSPGQKPHYESSDLEPFIRRKYCNKEFAEGTWPPAMPDGAMPATTADSSSAGVARQQQGGSASPATSPGAVAQLASDPSAGKLEAGGFWGSLTPQESGVPADQLPDDPVIGSITPGRLQSQRLPQARKPISVSTESPALLIDLMDFGAESTFQLPTTPRRQSSNAPAVSDATGSNSVGERGAATTIGGSSGAGVTRSQGSVKVAAAAAAGVNRQRSSFPLLPPPPQVSFDAACIVMRTPHNSTGMPLGVLAICSCHRDCLQVLPDIHRHFV